MTPERMAELVARWVRLYTRDLPGPIAGRRIEEMDADVRDHIAHERAQGTSDGRIALGILSRMVRGITADASWRGRHGAYRSTIGIVLPGTSKYCGEFSRINDAPKRGCSEAMLSVTR